MSKTNPKKVKTLVLMGGVVHTVGAADELPSVWDSWTWQDDVLIVGATIAAHWTPSHPNATQAGHAESLCHLTRHSTRFSPGEILHVSALARFLDTGVLTYAMIGDTTQRETVMFPEGYGMSFDEGDVVSLIGNGADDMFSAGTVAYSGWAIIYYIEK